MEPRILIMKFDYNLPNDEFRQLIQSVSPEFAKVPGCRWKIPLIDEEKKEGGAVYLFDDQNSIDTFLKSELVASVSSHPALSNFVFRATSVIEKAALFTYAPLERTTTELHM